jgi:hypothetical protein
MIMPGAHAGRSVHLAWRHYDRDTHENRLFGHGPLASSLPAPVAEVTRGQFSDMLRMLEAGRLKEFRFALEDEAEGSWPIHSWGMSAAFDDASR